MTKRFLAIVLGLAMIFSAGSAMAAMTSGQGNYDITLSSTCTIDTTMTSMSFGNWALDYGTTYGNPTLGAGMVGVNCSNGLAYILGADGGQYPNNGLHMGLPTMANGFGQYVAYYLFDAGGFYGTFGDANLTTIDPAYAPGNVNPTFASGWSNTGAGAWQYYSLSAVVYIDDPAQVAGFYTDTVTFTVVW